MPLVISIKSKIEHEIGISEDTIPKLSELIKSSLMQVDLAKPLDFDNGISTETISSTHLAIRYQDKYRETPRRYCINLHVADDYLVLVACKVFDFAKETNEDHGKLVDMVVDEDQDIKVHEDHLTWLNYQNNFVNGIKLSLYKDEDGSQLVIAKDVYVSKSIAPEAFLSELIDYIEKVQSVIDEFEELYC